MKLTCDICGSELQMLSGGQSAACVNCGMKYPLERLREKLQGTQTVSQSDRSEPSPEENSNERYLIITRKVDLMLCKAAVIIDGNPVNLNSQGKTTTIPISQGVHNIVLRVSDATGVKDIGQATISVGNYDWEGKFWLHRGAFKAAYRFEAKEMVE